MKIEFKKIDKNYTKKLVKNGIDEIQNTLIDIEVAYAFDEDKFVQLIEQAEDIRELAEVVKEIYQIGRTVQKLTTTFLPVKPELKGQRDVLDTVLNELADHGDFLVVQIDELKQRVDNRHAQLAELKNDFYSEQMTEVITSKLKEIEADETVKTELDNYFKDITTLGEYFNKEEELLIDFKPLEDKLPLLVIEAKMTALKEELVKERDERINKA